MQPCAVLNPGGNDPEQHFPEGAGEPDPSVHAPINMHAFAAATRGAFFDNVDAALNSGWPVVLLIRHKLKPTLKAAQRLKASGHPFWVCWKEAGLQQVAAQIEKPANLELYREILSLATGAVATTREVAAYYFDTPTHFIPTPYPVEEPAWDFSISIDERQGIFIGTREFKAPSRNHSAAIASAAKIAKQVGCGITVINTEGKTGTARIRALAPGVEVDIHEGPLPYPDYLHVIARHRVVWQMDSSSVPGQVAGDALLARVPCLGGNGAIEQIAFPDLGTYDTAIELLTDPTRYRAAIDTSQQIAREQLSFSVVAETLEQLARQVG